MVGVDGCFRYNSHSLMIDVSLSEWLRWWSSDNLHVVVTHEKHLNFILESSFPDCYILKI